jgi:hypothetical protein
MRLVRLGLWTVVALAVTGCASTSVTRTGAISSYEGMRETKSSRAQALWYADPALLSSARTLRIEPVAVGSGVGRDASEEQRALIANAVGRTLCNRLNDRFEIVEAGQPADLAVKVTITGIEGTNEGASVASIAVSIASPVPFTPRLPFGLGSFTAEGEAALADGRRAAALSWARGADIFTTDATVSRVGDAYQLSGAFAKDMAKLVLTGNDPFARTRAERGESEKPPKRPLAPACEAYGKGPGVGGFIARKIGAPPELADRGARKAETASD